MRTLTALLCLVLGGLCLALGSPLAADAQGVLGDVLAGKLVKPVVGQWAWYNLVDADSQKTYLLRQAIVGEEKVGRKTGHWLEVEIVPDIGFPSVYKMLLTGPASDPKNVHRLLIRQGDSPVNEVPVDQQAAAPANDNAKRRSQGDVDIETPKGVISAEHVVVNEGGAKVELWLNDSVRPMGIVRMHGPQGELTLRDYGDGGENAKSRLDMFAGKEGSAGRSIEVESGVVGEPRKLSPPPNSPSKSAPL